jgi:hypothetical protein
VILLYDGYMHEDAAEWGEYIERLRVAIDDRGGADAYVPFNSPDGHRELPGEVARHTQYARRDKWTGLEAPDARALLHLVFALREHLRAAAGKGDESEPLFVSHAKADGDGTARTIVDYVNDTGHDVPLETFYDAMELLPGEDFEDRFEKEISRGTLLAIVSDIYDSRPWCVFELTTAKRARRPIILADVGEVRTSRTFPYGANLPKIRVDARAPGTGWIEQLLVQAVTEGLRCDIFKAQADDRLASAGHPPAYVLPRPPELFDVVDCVLDPGIVVYPDPPVGRLEAEILDKATARLGLDLKFVTLSEVNQ